MAFIDFLKIKLKYSMIQKRILTISDDVQLRVQTQEDRARG